MAWHERLWDRVPEGEPDLEIIRRRVDRLFQLLDIRSGSNILDVACGTGVDSIEMALRGNSVTGLDRSPFMLEFARREAARRNARVRWVCADMRDIDWEEQFDVVMLRDVIFGIFDPRTNEEVLSRIVRSARRGGIVFLEVYNKSWAIEFGIERFLTYNESTDMFEGIIHRKSIDGETEHIEAKSHLLSLNEWPLAMEKAGVGDVRFSEPTGKKDYRESRIIYVYGRRRKDEA